VTYQQIGIIMADRFGQLCKTTKHNLEPNSFVQFNTTWQILMIKEKLSRNIIRSTHHQNVEKRDCDFNEYHYDIHQLVNVF